MSYQNPELDTLVNKARFADDPQLYNQLMHQAIRIAMAEVPRIPLWQPFLDVVMQTNITGYQFWFHLQPDFRQIGKA
jgi:peptide/nickel transport system substrate-binding protein